MIKCIAIDDEPLALELIEDNIKKTPFLHCVAKCLSTQQASEVMQREKIDLIFLDIEMPDINGIHFLKTLDIKPAVILVTAYEKYALDSYEFDVVDYLLKPVELERFYKAVKKAIDYIAFKNHQTLNTENTINDIFIKSEHKLIRLNISEITYIESLKDYIKIYTLNAVQPIVSLSSLKSMEDLLPTNLFVRVHRSFIIALKYIDYISRACVVVNNKSIPIGALYKENFLDKINTK